jgi:WD40 repeat protein
MPHASSARKSKPPRAALPLLTPSEKSSQSSTALTAPSEQVSLKSVFRCTRTLQGLYLGGKIQIVSMVVAESPDPLAMPVQYELAFCLHADVIHVVELASGSVRATITNVNQDEAISSFAVSKEGHHVVYASASTFSIHHVVFVPRAHEASAPSSRQRRKQQQQQQQIGHYKVVRSWKGHQRPILDLCFLPPINAPRISAIDQQDDNSNTAMDLVYDPEIQPIPPLCASASSDGNVRVWDAANGFCTHNFNGHQGPVNNILYGTKRAPTHTHTLSLALSLSCSLSLSLSLSL